VVDERFRRVGVRRAVEVESEAEVPATSSAVQGAYRVGQRVEHAKFGMGRVAAVEAANGDLKITVDFSNPMVGQKSLLAKFAKLKIVE
jgi:DNA helicase-2/ATP-dependent DNA helicase PcrA